jgi:DNA-binding FrmR family transcriptional regulator
MAHTTRDKAELLLRVRRIRGQLDALEKMLEQEADCSKTLHVMVACRGALNSLIAQVLEGHIRFHILNPEEKPSREQSAAAEEVIEVLKRYLR